MTPGNKAPNPAGCGKHTCEEADFITTSKVRRRIKKPVSLDFPSVTEEINYSPLTGQSPSG